MKRGFTLAELLIALLILGALATFTIPKLLNGQQDSRRKAIFRETITSIAAVYYQGYLTGEMRCDNLIEYTGAHLNAVRISGGTLDLATGAQVLSIDNVCTITCQEDLIVDWNGATGPNVLGDDQLYLSTFIDKGCAKPPGYIRAANAGSRALFEEIFGSS